MSSIINTGTVGTERIFEMWIYYTVISILGASVIFCFYKLKNSNGKIRLILTGIIFAATLFLTAFHFYMTFQKPDKTKKEKKLKLEKNYNYYSGKYFAEELYRKTGYKKDKKILIIASSENAKFTGSRLDSDKIQGMKDYFKLFGIKKVIIEKSAGKNGNSFKAEDFDRIISKHSDCSIVICTVGLPDNLFSVQSWNKKNEPFLALFGGKSFYIKELLKEKILIFAMIPYPGRDFADAPTPTEKNYRKLIKEHFIVISSENMGNIEERFPSLLL